MSETLDKEQTRITSLKQGLAYLYKTKEFADVIYIVGDEQFEGHRLVLSARSSEFDKLQKSFAVGKSIPIEDSNVTKSGFSSLFHFIYNESLAVHDKESIIEAFYAAQYFRVKALQDECLKEIEMWTIGLNEVFTLLEKGSGIPFLKSKCIKYIQDNPMDILYCSSFCTSGLDTMRTILEHNALQRIPVLELIKYVMEWSKTYLHASEMIDFSPVRSLLLSLVCTDKSKHLLATLGFENLSVYELAEDIPTHYPNLLTAEEIILFTTYKRKNILPKWCTGIEPDLCCST